MSGFILNPYSFGGGLVIQSKASQAFANATTYDVPLPSGIAIGDMILLGMCINDGGNCSAPGFSVITGASSGNTCGTVLGRIATGSEGATVTVSNHDVQLRVACALSLRISGNHASAAAEGSSAGANTSTPNPPNVTPSWGALDTMWLAFTMFLDDSRSITGYPTNYDDNHTEITSGGGSGGCVGLATRVLNAASENPGTFTLSIGTEAVAATVAVRPA